MRYLITDMGIKTLCDLNRKICRILKVSLRIRLLIPKAVFGVDFFMLLNPNMKKPFIYIGQCVFNKTTHLILQT